MEVKAHQVHKFKPNLLTLGVASASTKLHRGHVPGQAGQRLNRGLMSNLSGASAACITSCSSRCSTFWEGSCSISLCQASPTLAPRPQPTLCNAQTLHQMGFSLKLKNITSLQSKSHNLRFDCSCFKGYRLNTSIIDVYSVNKITNCRNALKI